MAPPHSYSKINVLENMYWKCHKLPESRSERLTFHLIFNFFFNLNCARRQPAGWGPGHRNVIDPPDLELAGCSPSVVVDEVMTSLSLRSEDQLQEVT